jgi:hypothetical protein
MNKRYACLSVSTLSDGNFAACLKIRMSSRTSEDLIEQENIHWAASSLDELVDKIVASSGQILVILSDHDFWIPIPLGMWADFSTPWIQASTLVSSGKHHQILPALFDEYSNQMLDSIFRFVNDIKHYGEIRS